MESCYILFAGLSTASEAFVAINSAPSLFMRLVISLLLIYNSVVPTHSQFYLGYTKGELKEFINTKQPNTKFTEGYVNNNSEYVVSWIIRDSNTQVAVYFINNISKSTCFIPPKEEINNWVSIFNKDYIVLSDTEWKTYIDGKVVLINIEYDDHYKYNIWMTDITE